MLKLGPTFEQIEREARTSRLKILPEKQKRTQQGILLDNVNFDDLDLSPPTLGWRVGHLGGFSPNTFKSGRGVGHGRHRKGVP